MSEALKKPNLPPLPDEPGEKKQRTDNVRPIRPQKKFYGFHFTGTGGEYFSIWIVNIFLSILTLGIFSAWGKVRAKKFFYNNTRFQGHTFDYHGNPISILKGRIIAFTVFAAYLFGPQFHPIFNIAGVALFAAVIPFFFAKALRFNAAVLSYRNIRFQFKGEVSEAYKIYFEIFMIPIVCSIGAGTLTYLQLTKQIPAELFVHVTSINLVLSFTPILYYALRANHILVSILNFVYPNLYYGKNKVEFNATKDDIKELIKKPYFMYAFKWLGLVLGMAIAGIFIFPPIVALVYLFSYIGFICISLKLPYLITDYVWSNLSFQKQKSHSRLKWKQFMSIGVGNFIFTGLSFGLYYPFGKVKMLKYKLNHRYFPAIDFESILADEKENESAVGDEFDDAFDLDISIGL